MSFFTGVYKRSLGDFDNGVLDRINNSKLLKFREATIEHVSSNLLTISYSSDERAIDSKKCCAFVAGDMIVPRTISNEEKNLSSQLSNSKEALIKYLKKSRGNFCGYALLENKKRFLLFTDKTAIRPLYYSISSDYIFFSSLLSEVVNLLEEPVDADSDALMETMSLGYALGDKTVYQNVKRLDVAQCLEVNAGAVGLTQYWDRSTISINTDITVNELLATFEDAISLRLSENEPTCFLSGGLDSRAIAAQLKKHRVQVNSFNYGTYHSQDNEFALQLANKLGLNHSEEILEKLHFPNWSKLIRNSLNAMRGQKANHVDRVWSGDGGSVCLGATYITEEIQTAINQDNIDRALSTFLQNQKISSPVTFFKEKELNDEKLLDSMKTSFSKGFGGRGFYNFLVENDQKRHLDNHFETMLDHNVDLVIPFFDSNFLDLLYSVPPESLLYHRLYSDWFSLFPVEARSTPWQTYPGHVPCPLKIDDDLKYQWGKKVKFDSVEDDRKVYDSIKRSPFYNKFDKSNLSLAMLLHRYKLRSYSHLISGFNRII